MPTLQDCFSDVHLLKHPFYQAWMQGEISRRALREYAMQYSHHVEAFPRYLGSIHSFCEDASARRDLLANLNDEEGLAYGVSHPELWLRFAEGMGASRADVAASRPGPAISKVIETFFRFARSSFHEGLGALYAYESQVPEVAESKIRGLIEHYQVTNPETLAFFEVHKIADIDHRDKILAILERLPETQKLEAQRAAREAAQTLWDFLSEVYDAA